MWKRGLAAPFPFSIDDGLIAPQHRENEVKTMYLSPKIYFNWRGRRLEVRKHLPPL
jgi:hypothetical protein